MILPAHPTRPLVIYGAGGHGQVVADAARCAGLELLGFVDDAPGAEPPPDTPLLDATNPQLKTAGFVVAIGDNAARQHVAGRLISEGRRLHCLVHPDATVSAAATLGPGVYVGARAVVGPGTTVGTAALINTAAVIEHDGQIQAAVHVAPGAVLGGGVHLEQGVLVGLGARVLPGLRVGAAAVLGAGAVLTRNAQAGRTYTGIPARATP